MPEQFLPRPRKARSGFRQTRYLQMLDNNLDINPSSRDDFEKKSLQSYHVSKSSR